jgi:hypothetical protein
VGLGGKQGPLAKSLLSSFIYIPHRVDLFVERAPDIADRIHALYTPTRPLLVGRYVDEVMLCFVFCLAGLEVYMGSLNGCYLHE